VYIYAAVADDEGTGSAGRSSARHPVIHNPAVAPMVVNATTTKATLASESDAHGDRRDHDRHHRGQSAPSTATSRLPSVRQQRRERRIVGAKL
jgi:hypothetical protein